MLLRSCAGNCPSRIQPNRSCVVYLGGSWARALRPQSDRFVFSSIFGVVAGTHFDSARSYMEDIRTSDVGQCLVPTWFGKSITNRSKKHPYNDAERKGGKRNRKLQQGDQAPARLSDTNSLGGVGLNRPRGKLGSGLD